MVAPVYLTAEQCAARLGVSRSLIYAALLSGALQGFRVGRAGKRGTWRVEAYSLDQWVQTLKVSAPPALPLAAPSPFRRVSPPPASGFRFLPPR